MPVSDLVFEKGEGIDLGSHGEHDFVYQSGEAVTDSGKSDFVFESGTGLGGSVVIDDFERGNLNPYNIHNERAYVDNADPVFEGQFSLKCESIGGAVQDGAVTSASGLPSYPQPGDTWRMDVEVQGSDVTLFAGFACQSEAFRPNGYHFKADYASQTIYLSVDNINTIVSANANLNYGTRYQPEFRWDEDGYIEITYAGTTISTTDTTYSGGGIYFESSRSDGVCILDDVRKT